jgi:hypothetical protein
VELCTRVALNIYAEESPCRAPHAARSAGPAGALGLSASAASLLVYLFNVVVSLRGGLVAGPNHRGVMGPPRFMARALRTDSEAEARGAHVDGATSPAAVFVLQLLALWLWHIPRLYEAALAPDTAPPWHSCS